MSGQRPARIPPRGELVNALELEDVARLTLPQAAYATIAGGDREAFDRITFRPRMMVPTLDLDLSVDLFGVTHFTPIVVGPVADQRRYHADGELATVRGAAAARAAVIVSSRSSVPIEQIVAAARTPLWYSLYADADADANTHVRVRQAVAAGCAAVCITAGASISGSRLKPVPRIDWKAIDAIVIKGVMTTGDAKAAVAQGVRGIVVSDHGGLASGSAAPIDVLPSIADAVGDKLAVLIDGGIRRNSDIVKALTLGARAVLLARPVMWGLAAYGADGVQTVIEILQTDVARNMGALGAPNVASLTRNMVKIHQR